MKVESTYTHDKSFDLFWRKKELKYLIKFFKSSLHTTRGPLEFKTSLSYKKNSYVSIGFDLN